MYPVELLEKLPPDQPNLKLICYMLSMGMPHSDIAKVVGLSTRTITMMTESESVRAVTGEIERHLFANSPMQKFHALVPQAVKQLEYLMLNADKDSVKLRAIEIILERSLGKVVQQLEVQQHSTLKLLLEKVHGPATLDDEAPFIVGEYATPGDTAQGGNNEGERS